MGIFDDRPIGWKDRDYVVPADRVLGAIARIEDVLTFQELLDCTQRRVVPIAKLAQAYGAVLRYAGARVADEEIYLELMQSMTSDGSTVEATAAAIEGLLTLMMPVTERKVSGQANAGNSPEGVTNSSASSSQKSSEDTAN